MVMGEKRGKGDAQSTIWRGRFSLRMVVGEMAGEEEEEGGGVCWRRVCVLVWRR